MSELVAVAGDECDHDDGALICANNDGKAFISGKKVAIVDSNASADELSHSGSAVSAATGSSKVYVSGIRVHRNDDSRYCGAKTIVTNQSKVFIG